MMMKMMISFFSPALTPFRRRVQSLWEIGTFVPAETGGLQRGVAKRHRRITQPQGKHAIDSGKIGEKNHRKIGKEKQQQKK